MAPASSSPSPSAPKRPSRRSRATAKPAVDGVRLTADRIVVRHPEAGERTSRAGLLIPATAAPAPKRCVWSDVILVGPDVRSVKSGDRVLFLPQAGLELEFEGDEFLLLRERDVQAVAAAPEAGERAPGQYL
jgi:chaperonin GroES